MVEKKTASKAGRAAMPGPWSRPSFSRSISCLSTSKFLRASVSHTGTACRMPFCVLLRHRRTVPRRSSRRSVDRMDLDSLGFDVPWERQLPPSVSEPVGLAPDHDVVVDAVGVVVAVDQVLRAAYGVRGVFDEHQTSTSLVGPASPRAFDPYTTSRLRSPPGTFFSRSR